jgi:hypothetical protein
MKNEPDDLAALHTENDQLRERAERAEADLALARENCRQLQDALARVNVQKVTAQERPR